MTAVIWTKFKHVCVFVCVYLCLCWCCGSFRFAFLFARFLKLIYVNKPRKCQIILENQLTGRNRKFRAAMSVRNRPSSLTNKLVHCYFYPLSPLLLSFFGIIVSNKHVQRVSVYFYIVFSVAVEKIPNFIRATIRNFMFIVFVSIYIFHLCSQEYWDAWFILYRLTPIHIHMHACTYARIHTHCTRMKFAIVRV